MALWIPCCLSHLTCETFKGQCFLAIGMFSIVFLSSLAPVHISSQNCVQLELFGAVGAPRSELICQYWSVPLQFWTLGCNFVGHNYFHRSIPPLRGPGSLANCWAPFWLELQMRAVSQGTCDVFIISIQTWLWSRNNINCLFPALGGCRAVLSPAVLFSYSATSHKDCWLLWEPFLNCTGPFHKENVLLLETPFV